MDFRISTRFALQTTIDAPNQTPAGDKYAHELELGRAAQGSTTTIKRTYGAG